MVRRRGDDRGLVTLLFTDIVGSSEVVTELGDRRWRTLQARHHAEIRKQLKRHGGREVDTAGDGFFATFRSPAAGVRCAFAIVRGVRDLGLDIRAGLHIGEVESKRETELKREKLSGIAVTTAARVSAAAGPGQVLATDTIVHMVAGSGLEFMDLGSRELKGVPGRWEIFSLDAVDGESIGPPPDAKKAAESRERASPPKVPQRSLVRGLPLGVGAILAALIVGVVLLQRDDSGPVAKPPPSGPTQETLVALSDATGDVAFPISLPLRRGPVGPIVLTGRTGSPTAFAWIPQGYPSQWFVPQVHRTGGAVADGGERFASEVEYSTCLCVASAAGRIWTPIGAGRASAGILIVHGVALRGLGLSSDASEQVILDAGLDTTDIASFVSGAGYLWVGDTLDDRIYRFNPATSAIKIFDLRQSPDVLVFGDGNLWVLDKTAGKVARVDPSTGRHPPPFAIAGDVLGMAVGGGYVWLTDASGSAVERIPEDLGSAPTDISVGQIEGPPSGVAYDDGALVVGFLRGAVAKINPSDPSSPAVIWTRRIGNNASSIAVDGDVVWTAGSLFNL